MNKIRNEGIAIKQIVCIFITLLIMIPFSSCKDNDDNTHNDENATSDRVISSSDPLEDDDRVISDELVVADFSHTFRQISAISLDGEIGKVIASCFLDNTTLFVYMEQDNYHRILLYSVLDSEIINQRYFYGRYTCIEVEETILYLLNEDLKQIEVYSLYDLSQLSAYMLPDDLTLFKTENLLDGISISPNGNMLAYALGNLYVYDVESGTETIVKKTDEFERISNVIFFSDNIIISSIYRMDGAQGYIFSMLRERQESFIENENNDLYKIGTRLFISSQNVETTGNIQYYEHELDTLYDTFIPISGYECYNISNSYLVQRNENSYRIYSIDNFSEINEFIIESNMSSGYVRFGCINSTVSDTFFWTYDGAGYNYYLGHIIW